MTELLILTFLFLFIGFMSASPFLAVRLRKSNPDSRTARILAFFGDWDMTGLFFWSMFLSISIGSVALLFTELRLLGIAGLIMMIPYWSFHTKDVARRKANGHA